MEKLKYEYNSDIDKEQLRQLFESVGWKTGEHTRDVEELIFALKGETYVITADEEYKLEQGDSILIPAGIKHYHANKSSETIEQIYLFAPQGPEKTLRDLEIIK